MTPTMLDSFKDLVHRTRTFRRFEQKAAVELEVLKALLDLARLGGSARNAQPLKYILANTPQACEKIFPHLGWAGYLSDWPGPARGERPSAYIICLRDTTIAREADFDLGIASQNLLLGATLVGLGGCRIASIAKGLTQELNIAPPYELMMVIALGKPKETVAIERLTESGDIKYWRDANQIHHVPKRPLAEILLATL